MNYEKLYHSLCESCRNVDPVLRMRRRNPNDDRLKNGELYLEKHHIVPKHCGGDDSTDNLVKMLPEEHILAHLIRYKAYRDRNDFLAVRFCINGMKNPNVYKKGLESLPITTLNKRVSLFRRMSRSFRKRTGWHTSEGLEAIRKSKFGKMPAKDAVTDEFVGVVDIDHPNVQSGVWVHSTTGTVVVWDTVDKRRTRVLRRDIDDQRYQRIRLDHSGSKNGNFKMMTDERKQRLFDLIPQSLHGDNLIVTKLIRNMKVEFVEWKKISKVWIINNFGNIQNMVNEYKIRTVLSNKKRY